MPLKGREGLGNEVAEGERYIPLFREGPYVLRQSDNSLDILVRFRGKANHEIETQGLHAAFKNKLRRGENVFLGDLFVDDISQPLGSGLGRDRNTPLIFQQGQNLS